MSSSLGIYFDAPIVDLELVQQYIVSLGYQHLGDDYRLTVPNSQHQLVADIEKFARDEGLSYQAISSLDDFLDCADAILLITQVERTPVFERLLDWKQNTGRPFFTLIQGFRHG